MLIPRQVIELVGYFDDKYFLVSEDSDLCYRIRKAGLKLIINGDATIYHKVSATAGGHYSSITQYYFHRNRMIFLSKILPRYKKILFYLSQFLIIIPLWSIFEILKGKYKPVGWAWRGYTDFIKGRTGKCPHFNSSHLSFDSNNLINKS